MIREVVMPPERWLAAALWYRGADHQRKAYLKLYAHLLELPGGACLLSENAEWFQDYRARDKLLHDFMHPEGN
jgi:hypothetical protein